MESELARVFLLHSASTLRTSTDAIHACLNRLDDQQIWRRSSRNENAIGNLVLHLCGNVRQWIVAGVGGDKDIRQRDLEFSAQGGLSRQALERLLDETIASAKGVIESLEPERLLQQIKPQHEQVTVLQAIYHVTGHFQHHTGQIIFATKVFTQEDLQIYRSPFGAAKSAAI